MERLIEDASGSGRRPTCPFKQTMRKLHSVWKALVVVSHVLSVPIVSLELAAIAADHPIHMAVTGKGQEIVVRKFQVPVCHPGHRLKTKRSGRRLTACPVRL